MLFTCRKCQTRVEGESIKVFGFHYHPQCFVCFDCNKHLNDHYFEIDRLPYCELDYKRPRPGQPTNSPKISIKKPSTSSESPKNSRTFNNPTNSNNQNNNNSPKTNNTNGTNISKPLNPALKSKALTTQNSSPKIQHGITVTNSPQRNSTSLNENLQNIDSNSSVNPITTSIVPNIPAPYTISYSTTENTEPSPHPNTSTSESTTNTRHNVVIKELAIPKNNASYWNEPASTFSNDSTDFLTSEFNSIKVVFGFSPRNNSNYNDSNNLSPSNIDSNSNYSKSNENIYGMSQSTSDVNISNQQVQVQEHQPQPQQIVVESKVYQVEQFAVPEDKMLLINQQYQNNYQPHQPYLPEQVEDVDDSKSDSSSSSSSSPSCSTPAKQQTVEVFIPAPTQSTIEIVDIPQPHSAPTIVSPTVDLHVHVHHHHNDTQQHDHHHHNHSNSHHVYNNNDIEVDSDVIIQHQTQPTTITTTITPVETPEIKQQQQQYSHGFVDSRRNVSMNSNDKSKTSSTTYTQSNVYSVSGSSTSDNNGNNNHETDGQKNFTVSYIEDKSNFSRPPAFACHKCNKEIWGSTIFNAQGDKFHPHCFSCYVCRAPLVDAYFQDDSGYLCAGCQVILNERNKQTRQQLGHCNICYKRFTSDDSFISIEREKYHKQCFKCCVCKNVIEGLDYSRDKVTASISNYCCFTCLDNGRADRCPECLGAIVGGASIFALGKSYHPQCFKCSLCKVNIPHGTKFSSDAKQPACTLCRPLNNNQQALAV